MKYSLSSILIRNVVQMNNVWAKYDSKNIVLKGLSLSIERGTIYAIIGKSGSGKSTLLKLINGMIVPNKGSIKVDYTIPNINNSDFKKIMPKIGYIPQSLGLIKNLSVLDNTLIGALPRIGKIKSFFRMFPNNEINEAKNILKTVGLKEKLYRKVYMLSGGEKRRVAIARALMQKPNILLADEIVSELDHITAVEIMNLIKIAQKKFNLTSIMVHHDIQLALEYANRVAVIQDGKKILEIGTEGNQIVDFQTGDISQQEILKMYGNES